MARVMTIDSLRGLANAGAYNAGCACASAAQPTRYGLTGTKKKKGSKKVCRRQVIKKVRDCAPNGKKCKIRKVRTWEIVACKPKKKSRKRK